MGSVRVALAGVLLVLAVTVQLSVLPHLAIASVVIDLVLLVVVALGLARGPEFGAVAGFCAGVLLDVVPPADHTAGRWALALALAGYLAGLIRRDAPVGPWQVGISVLLCTTLAHIVFVSTGALLRDPDVQRGDVGTRLGVAIGYDVLAAVLVVPLVIWLIGRFDSADDDRRRMDSRALL
jgi:rod shape-determining protein MreD